MSINNSVDYHNQAFDSLETNFTGYSNSDTDLFGSSSIKETMNEIHTNASLIQTYVASCLTQRDIELDKIPSIKKTQQEIREHARLWSKDLAPKIGAIYTDVTGFCSLAGDHDAGFWKDLTAIAHQIKSQNDEKVSEFKDIIGVFKEDIEDRKGKTLQLKNKLEGFKNYLFDDYNNFQTIIDKAKTIYSGSGGKIEVINRNIEAIKSAIDKNIGIIASGAIAIVTGITTIVVGAVGTVFTGGTTVKMIVAGIIFTGGGIAATAVASKNLVEKQKDYGSALQELANIKGEVAALKNVEDNFSGLQDKNKNASQAVESMINGWTVLYNNFNELENSVNKLDTNKRNLLVNRLTATKNNFDNLSLQAQNMQKNSILKVQVTTDIMNYMGFAKTFYSFPTYALCTKRLTKSSPFILDLPEFADLIR